MRSSIILPDSYHHMLVHEGLQNGLLKEYDIGIYDEELDAEANRKLYEMQYNRFRSERQKFYQTILLYDEFIIPDGDASINYDGLAENGFLVHEIENYLAYDPFKDEAHEESVECLREVVVPYIAKNIQKRFLDIDPEANIRAIAEALYDCILLGKSIPENEEEIIELYLGKQWIETEGSLAKYIDHMFVQEILGCYTDICWKLDISSKNDAYLYNTGYDLTKFGVSEASTKDKYSAYGKLKIGYKNVCGESIGFNNFEEVLKVKKERKSELRDLKNEINKLTDILNTGNLDADAKALETAIKDIQKADRALKKNLPLIAQVGEMSTVMGISLEAMNQYTDFFARYPLPTAITVAGASALVAGKYLERHNEWIELIR